MVAADDLLEDLDAVPVLVHHALQTPDLALNPAQALLEGVLVVDVAGSHGPPIAVPNTPIGYRRTSAVRWGDDRRHQAATALNLPRIPSPSSRMPLARASAKLLQPEPHLLAPRLVRPAPGHGRERVVRRERRWERLMLPPLHGGVERRRETVGLRPDLGLVALLEGREHLPGEELE